MERAHAPYHGRYGIYLITNNLDFFTSHSNAWSICRFLGSFAEKIGPKKSGLLAMLFWVAGLFGTAYALSIHSLTLLYLFYGIIGGIGLGIGYITPVSTLVKYFPNRPGFATGLAIMGFGFASLIAGPLMQYLVAHVGLVNNFIILGITYLIVMSASSLYLKAPTPKRTNTL